MRKTFRGGDASSGGGESVAGRHGDECKEGDDGHEEMDDGVHEDERLKRSVLLVLLRCTPIG